MLGKNTDGTDINRIVVAHIIGHRLNLPVVSIPREEADARFGFFSAFASSDNPTSSAELEEGRLFND